MFRQKRKSCTIDEERKILKILSFESKNGETGKSYFIKATKKKKSLKNLEKII